MNIAIYTILMFLISSIKMTDFPTAYQIITILVSSRLAYSYSASQLIMSVIDTDIFSTITYREKDITLL